MTSNVVPPALIVDGAKSFEIVGRLGVIESKSAAVQVPDVQSALVLLTPDGTEMVAVLTT